MDEEDIKECKLRDGPLRSQDRYVEVRRGGVDLHYLSCAAMIDGKGGERIVQVGTKHLCLSERNYLGVMVSLRVLFCSPVPCASADSITDDNQLWPQNRISSLSPTKRET